MSEDRGRVGQYGAYGAENSAGAEILRASINRSVIWCLISDRNPRMRIGISHAGVAHTFAVCMLEMMTMARGKSKSGGLDARTGMPRFIDVRLSAEDREGFREWAPSVVDLVGKLSEFCDAGYRVGASWSGETQAYTVSLTCRNPDDANNGLCMTSFARELRTAVALAVYKHEVIANGVWVSGEERDFGDFG